MKPEHFIYKSDGLYYMQNVPEEPNKNSSSYHPNDEWFYLEAIERAKEEAVKVEWAGCETIARLILLKYGETKEGEIYTINMEEKIEVVKTDDIKCTHCVHDCYKSGVTKCGTYARIAAPEREDDSQAELSKRMFIDYAYAYTHACCDDDRQRIINEFISEFEIKRKAL